jgi:hypothetical protein
MSLGLCNSLGRLGLEEHDKLQACMTRISERAQTQAQAQAQAQRTTHSALCWTQKGQQEPWATVLAFVFFHDSKMKLFVSLLT